MNIVAYYEGDESVKDWLCALLNINIKFKKMPTGNYSSDFFLLPSYISDILFLDKPDIIIAGSVDNIHEKPIFSIEFASCTPQFQHALQRFSRMVASVSNGCPSLIIMPENKLENSSSNESGNGKNRTYQRSQAVEYGAVRLMDIYNIPAFIFDWPVNAGIMENENNTNYPLISSDSMQSLKKLIIDAIKAFEDIDYIGALWRSSEVRKCVDHMRYRAYKGGVPTITSPGGGLTKKCRPNLELVKTNDLILKLQNLFGEDIINQIPDFIVSREESVVFYPTRIIEHAGDPYVGMLSYYDIAFCRIGKDVRDRQYNLIAHAEKLNISNNILESMKKINTDICPFKNYIDKDNIIKYSYFVKRGCRSIKSKPVRIYSEIADLIIFKDGMLFNVG